MKRIIVLIIVLTICSLMVEGRDPITQTNPLEVCMDCAGNGQASIPPQTESIGGKLIIQGRDVNEEMTLENSINNLEIILPSWAKLNVNNDICGISSGESLCLSNLDDMWKASENDLYTTKNQVTVGSNSPDTKFTVDVGSYEGGGVWDGISLRQGDFQRWHLVANQEGNFYIGDATHGISLVAFERGTQKTYFYNDVIVEEDLQVNGVIRSNDGDVIIKLGDSEASPVINDPFSS